MKTRKVVVLPYNENWKTEFEAIKQELEGAVGDLALAIEHVGSTSVEGMWAKPCIDIDLIIANYDVFEEVKQSLEKIGYIHEGDLGIKDREAFKYEDKPHLQKHHLYVCPENSKELHRHLTFRDFLRSNPEAAKEYSESKRKAAELYPNDIDGYINYKAPCIEKLYKLCGDANCNGVADKMDIRNLREYLIGAKQIALADVNNDGASNICDLAEP